MAGNELMAWWLAFAGGAGSIVVMLGGAVLAYHLRGH